MRLLPLVVLLSACGSSAYEPGGYRFYTQAVDDQCLDGALDVLWMPEGPATEQRFEFLINVPAWDALPQSYAIDLREPFLGMPVEVSGVDDHIQVDGGLMESVLLNEGQYGDCVTSMKADITLFPTQSGEFTGDATIEVSDPRGDDGRCPPFEADPCQVLLQIRGELEEPAPE